MNLLYSWINFTLLCENTPFENYLLRWELNVKSATMTLKLENTSNTICNKICMRISINIWETIKFSSVNLVINCIRRLENCNYYQDKWGLKTKCFSQKSNRNWYWTYLICVLRFTIVIISVFCISQRHEICKSNFQTKSWYSAKAISSLFENVYYPLVSVLSWKDAL